MSKYRFTGEFLATANEKFHKLNNVTQTLKKLHDIYENIKIERQLEEDNIDI